MEPDDDVLGAVLAVAGTIRLEDVEAELGAAMADPLLQDVVERAVAHHLGHRTEEQRQEAQGAILAYLATNPRVERLLDEIRSGGGKSHVVESGSAAGREAGVAAPKDTRRRSSGR
jgi:hypothetical protein